MRLLYSILLHLTCFCLLALNHFELGHTSASLSSTNELHHQKEFSKLVDEDGSLLKDIEDGECRNFGDSDLQCHYNYSCVYGARETLKCESLITKANCSSSYTCSFCFQLPPEQYNCTMQRSCHFRSLYKAVCFVPDNVACLGERKFYKNVRCETASHYRWSTALFLSITLGGFGLDRFYLGNWQEGIGKLFSFGGLGIWTLIDVILVATGYLKPIDGSVFV